MFTFSEIHVVIPIQQYLKTTEKNKKTQKRFFGKKILSFFQKAIQLYYYYYYYWLRPISSHLANNIFKVHMKSVRFLRSGSEQSYTILSCILYNYPCNYDFHPKDFDDCSMWGVCDQLCEDRTGSHRCSCRDGYILEQHRYCRADISGTCYFLSPNAHKLHVLIIHSNWLYGHTLYWFWKPPWLIYCALLSGMLQFLTS